MALLSLLYKTARNKIGTLELHATLREAHEHQNDITEHPVESGANIVDHVRTKPKTLVIEGVVTNTPIRSLLEATNGEKYQQGEPGLSQTAFDLLWKLADGHDLLEVATSMRLYKRMVISSLQAPRDAGTGEALRFTATLREIRLVEVKTKKLEVREAKHETKTKKNKQEPTKAKQPEVLKSIAARGYDSETGQALVEAIKGIFAGGG